MRPLKKPTVSRGPAWSRPGFIGTRCPRCGQIITKHERIVVTDTPTNGFRGDDDVTARHERCPVRA